MLQELQEYTVPLLTELVLGVLAIVIPWGFSRLRDFVADRIRHQWAERFAQVVGDVVSEVLAEVGPVVKAAAADGVITPDEWRHIADVALEKLQSYIGPKGVQMVRWVWMLDSPEQAQGRMRAAIAGELRRQLPTGVVVAEREEKQQ